MCITVLLPRAAGKLIDFEDAIGSITVSGLNNLSYVLC
jgi:hypothetical protein